MSTLAYTISTDRMTGLLETSGPRGYKILGLFFETHAPGKDHDLHDDLFIVPVFSTFDGTHGSIQDLRGKGSAGSVGQFLIEEGGANVLQFGSDGTPGRHPSPSKEYLYKELEGGADLPGFVYFDEVTLRLMCAAGGVFVLSGCAADTNKLMVPREGSFGKRQQMSNLKLELVDRLPLPGEKGLEGLMAAQKGPSYHFGQPCVRSWYYY